MRGQRNVHSHTIAGFLPGRANFTFRALSGLLWILISASASAQDPDVPLIPHPSVVYGYGAPLDVDWNTSGTRLATAMDTFVRIIEPIQGTITNTFLGHHTRVREVDFTSDSQHVWSIDEDGMARLWHIASDTELLTLNPGSDLGTFALDPSEQHIAFGVSHEIKIYDAQSGEFIRAIENPTTETTVIVFSPDGASLLSAGISPWLRRWDVGTGTLIDEIELQTSGINGITFHPDGDRFLVSAQSTYEISLTPFAMLNMIPYVTKSACYFTSPIDGPLWLANYGSAAAVAWEPSSGSFVRDYFSVNGWSGIHDIARYPNSTQFLVAYKNSPLQLYDIDNSRSISAFEGGNNFDVTSAAFSSDHTRVATADQFGILIVRDLDDGTVLSSSEVFPDYPSVGVPRRTIVSLAFCENDSQVLLTNSDEPILRYDPALDMSLTSYSYEQSAGGADVLVSDQARRVFYSAHFNQILKWSIDQKDPLLEFRDHQRSIHELALSPDGSRLLSGGGDRGGGVRDNVIRLWDVESTAPLRRLVGHISQIDAIQFHPTDPLSAASVSFDHQLIIWNLENGQMRWSKDFGSTEYRGQSIAYSSDGRFLYLAHRFAQPAISVFDSTSGILRLQIADIDLSHDFLHYDPSGPTLSAVANRSVLRYPAAVPGASVDSGWRVFR